MILLNCALLFGIPIGLIVLSLWLMDKKSGASRSSGSSLNNSYDSSSYNSSGYDQNQVMTHFRNREAAIHKMQKEEGLSYSDASDKYNTYSGE